jgi:hypothetical protein
MDQNAQIEEILAWFDIVPTAEQRELFRRAVMTIDGLSESSWWASTEFETLLHDVRQSRAQQDK